MDLMLIDLLESSKAIGLCPMGIGVLSNSGSDPLKNHEATEPLFNVGLSSARQGNAI